MARVTQILPTEVGKWNVSALRITSFPSPNAQLSESPNWWQSTIGQPPDKRVEKPRLGGLKEEGAFAKGQLVLSIQPIRIDWLYLPILNPEHSEAPFQSIGTWEESLGVFIPKILGWLKNSPASQRLAFGAAVNLPVSDRSSGYKKLADYLPFLEIDPVNSSDLLYQINRPRISALLPGLTINRLSKWVVVKGQIMSMNATDNRPAAGKEMHACQAEFDINTAQEFIGPELPRGREGEVTQELVGLARELLQKGDIV